MSLIAKDSGNVQIEKLEAGAYTAISSMLIDLGMQNNEKFGKTQRKFKLFWNILGETVTIGDEELPRTISKEYSLSLGEKSNLRKDLQAWRARPFSEEELKGFKLTNILNKGCQLQIIINEKNGKTYNDIAGIMSLPKGTTIQPLEETVVFDLEEQETWINWGKIPAWVQEQIKKAENYVESGLSKYVEEYEEIVAEQEGKKAEESSNVDLPEADDDLPF